MAKKLIVWSPEQARVELQKRIDAAFTFRKQYEGMWDMCERSVFNTRGKSLSRSYGAPLLNDVDFGLPDVDGSNADSGVNYVFKNWRFTHAQLSANPPSVAARPLTPDAEDRRKALAAEQLKGYFLRKYDLQETTDQITAQTLCYGTGFGKVFNDPDRGEILDIEADGTIITEGDFAYKALRTWDIGIDPDATCIDELRFMIERQFIPYEEALGMWPEHEEELEKARIRDSSEQAVSQAMTPRRWDVVEVYEYWEKGLHVNGMLGRFALCLKDGTLLEPVKPNPHAFAPPAKSGKMSSSSEPTKKKYKIAQLPYVVFTDVDVPGQVWGMSSLMYAITMQDVLNNIDSAAVDNAYAHSVTRLILPEGAELRDGSITNSPWDIIKITGVQPPHYMPPQPLQQATINLRNMYRQGIDDVFGVNESMFGQQSRETSGFSMQYATNQGNMIRRRLFNKYTKMVESVYKHLFNLVREHWDTERTIHVMGDENTMQALSISGMDVDGGFDIVGEYGTNFSLDPITRRQEILTLYPILKEAGVEPAKIKSMLKLNDFEDPSMAELGEARQKEIFQRMIANEISIDPEEMQEHKSMLAYAYMFLMTAEFRDLDPDSKTRIKDHIKKREALINMAAGVQPPPGAPGAPLSGSQPVPPAAAGMTGEPVSAAEAQPIING